MSAKDVILEMLRRHGVKGGVGRIIEYHGPGLDSLSAMDRHVIANMGAELGATTSVFPADERVRAVLDREGRGNISTDEILPAGARVLPFRSDIARACRYRPCSPLATIAADVIGSAVSAIPRQQNPAMPAAAPTGPRVTGNHIILLPKLALSCSK